MPCLLGIVFSEVSRDAAYVSDIDLDWVAFHVGIVHTDESGYSVYVFYVTFAVARFAVSYFRDFFEYPCMSHIAAKNWFFLELFHSNRTTSYAIVKSI